MVCNTPPSQCHQPTGSCSAGTCSYSLKPSGSVCNDGNDCTYSDICGSTGTCNGTPVVCPGAAYCHGGVCKPYSLFTYTLYNPYFSGTYEYRDSTNTKRYIFVEIYKTYTICAIDGSVNGGPYTKGGSCQ
jgi:hypothetical protein